MQTISAVGSVLCFGFNDATQGLMNSFVVIIVSELSKDIVKLLDGGENQMIQTFGFDGFDKAFA